MRATIKNYIAALKQRREEHGESGFSLIELIVVVAILGILVAIAIPVFGLIQDSAKDNALKTVAANAATSAAAQLAQQGTVADWSDLQDQLSDSDSTVAITGTSLESVCATAKAAADGSLTGGTRDTTGFKSGPGC